MTDHFDPPPAGPQRPRLEVARLWAGGAATAVVAALIALVGVLIVRAVLRIAVYAPADAGAFGDSSTVTLCLVCAAAALAATGLLHLLLIATPRPLTYFSWIVGLLTGYLGGAVCAQLRVGAPLWTFLLVPIYTGVLVWLGLYLRSPALRALVRAGS